MLKGKVAVVTGSTSGIGLGIAQALAAEGADLLLNGFGDVEQISALVARLAQECGVKVTHNSADMSKPDQVTAMVGQCVRDLGRIDILVNDSATREKISQNEARLKLLGEKQPSLEFATPEQIGSLAAFLSSPAADQIRGATLSIDGGWTAQ